MPFGLEKLSDVVFKSLGTNVKMAANTQVQVTLSCTSNFASKLLGRVSCFAHEIASQLFCCQDSQAKQLLHPLTSNFSFDHKQKIFCGQIKNLVRSVTMVLCAEGLVCGVLIMNTSLPIK